jgi:hypothetical protein
VLKITWRQAAAWRLHRQHLDSPAPARTLLAVASRLCGLHAQVMSSAELTLWARSQDLERGAVQRALWEDRTLVKTWAMRGTLHLLPASELPVWCAALSTNGRYLRSPLWKKYFGITLEQLDQLTEAIAAALDGRVMTREELVRHVERITGSTAFAANIAASSWGTMLKPAAFTGRLCFGPSAGQRVQFTRPDTWLGQALDPIDTEVATSFAARRFLEAYGPATDHDLARWWNGGGVTTARQWVSALGEEVAPVDLEGVKAWMLTAHLREIRDLPRMRSVRLLPAFDQYVIAASRHARQLLPGDLRSRVFRPQGWISPVLLVNGFMQGVWRSEIHGSRVEVSIEPFVMVPAWVRRAAGREAERLAAFLGARLDLKWKTA